MSDNFFRVLSQNITSALEFTDPPHCGQLVPVKLDTINTKRPLEDGIESQSKKVASAPSNIALAGMTSTDISTSPTASQPTVQVDMHVPNSLVGLIIGRGGEQISRVQAESGCNIQIAQDTNDQPDRVCTLTGSALAVNLAREMINNIVNLKVPLDHIQEPPLPAISRLNFEEIIIPGTMVGLIIGKGGDTIKHLQEKSGAKMVVVQDGPNPELEKPLRISGEPLNVEHAKKLVMELMAERELRCKPSRESMQRLQGIELIVPRIAVGVVIGKGGDMMKRIQCETGCKVHFYQTKDDGPGDKLCFIQGKSEEVNRAQQMIEDLIESVNNSHNKNQARAIAASQRITWPMVVSFCVSNLKCGIIIGKGGEVIKQINAQSGAHCQLDRRTFDNFGNRKFFIRGNRDQVEEAKRLIQEKAGMTVTFFSESSKSGPGLPSCMEVPSAKKTICGASHSECTTTNEHYEGVSGYSQKRIPENFSQSEQQAVLMNPSTSQPDYSQQWIEYYRSLGMIREAETIEKQAKAMKIRMIQLLNPHELQSQQLPTQHQFQSMQQLQSHSQQYTQHQPESLQSVGSISDPNIQTSHNTQNFMNSYDQLQPVQQQKTEHLQSYPTQSQQAQRHLIQFQQTQSYLQPQSHLLPQLHLKSQPYLQPEHFQLQAQLQSHSTPQNVETKPLQSQQLLQQSQLVRTQENSEVSNQADYSLEWVNYYRSIGKFKEAEIIEGQIHLKKSAIVGVARQNVGEAGLPVREQTVCTTSTQNKTGAPLPYYSYSVTGSVQYTSGNSEHQLH